MNAGGTAEGPLTAERILQATEDVLRRYGPAKATVVDVARALGVSHGSVYRHFPSKAALREAVTQRWLFRAHIGLAEIAAEPGPAPERLRRWLAALFAAKRRKALDDPELFATYSVLVAETSTVIAEHIQGLVDQVARIVADGAAAGEFTVADAAVAARAVFDATARFHDPVHAAEWSRPGIDASFDAVCWLVLAGLGAGG
ncbi:TetR/AcrR family transcriptional regulator [Gandjariella thermophila]|uniref:TetR family transcriptional regulator n=1 Tax=Gandjariella thermophila TaxID=1931992 RepID=A0A4D4IWG8_9PSEU|nr:TetR/AcrR family transcriptional regulator [Gandjariella thermophila]GDY28531.1 TetR family transcriptional regulator [Gandjariella thermophila]